MPFAVLAGAVAAAVAVAVGAVLPPGGGGPADRSAPTRDATAFAVRPGCAGRGCDGRDPMDMGCGGEAMVATLAERTAPGGRRVELREGTACRAVWARATRLRPGDRVRLSLPGAPGQEVRAPSGGAGGGYLATRMTGLTGTADARTARVCLLPAQGRGLCFSGRTAAQPSPATATSLAQR